MAQPNAQEIWVKAAREDNSLLPNKKTLEYFKGNGGIEVNPDGGVCHVYDMQISDYITDYDTRRINGLAGPTGNTHGADGWGASAYGVFQDVYFDHKPYALSRHRSLAYRLHQEKTYAGNIGQYVDSNGKSSWLTTGESLEKIGEQMLEVKKRVERDVIGVDMDKYNMMCACNGHISGRAVPNSGYMDQIFDGDCEHFTWVAQPGPYSGADLPPRFAPIQGIEFDLEHILESLHCLRVAWNTVGIPSEECVILMDPSYAFKVRQPVINPFPTDGARQELIDGINIKDGFKMQGFNFSFDIPTSYYPKVWVDDNLNVVHSANGNAAYDKFINSITPASGDPNPLLTKLIASHRMGVNNFVRTEWNSTSNEFEKVVWNYPLGETGSVDYFGDKLKVPFSRYKEPSTYPFYTTGAGHGLPPSDAVLPSGYTAKATGPKLEHTDVPGTADKRRVIGLALYPKAVVVSQAYSNVVSDEGKTRGKFTEMCWDIKYDCWVLEQFAAGVIPIFDIDDSTVPTIAVSVKNVVETNSKVTPATGSVFDVDIINPTDDPVNTKEVTSTNAANKKKATK